MSGVYNQRSSNESQLDNHTKRLQMHFVLLMLLSITPLLHSFHFSTSVVLLLVIWFYRVFLTVPTHFQYLNEKKLAQPRGSFFLKKRRSSRLQLTFNLGKENREEQLKNTLFDFELVWLPLKAQNFFHFTNFCRWIINAPPRRMCQPGLIY